MEAFGQTTSITKKSSGETPVNCLTFNCIRTGGLSDMGQFRTMKDRFGWRARKTLGSASARPTEEFYGNSVDVVEWLCIGNRSYALRIVMKDSDLLYYSGFKDLDYESLRDHIKVFWGKSLKIKKLSSRGWSWGTKVIQDKSFIFRVDNQDAFEIPRERINQVSFTRGGISISLDNDELRAETEDQLLDIRFHVPVGKSGTDEHMESLSKTFASLPLSRSRALSQPICIFQDVKVLIPSGRFDIHIMKTMVMLHGKSNDFKIPYDIITQMFLLHGASSPHVNLVLQLSSPLRKGHTPYYNAVLRFDYKKDTTIQLEATQQELEAIESSMKDNFSQPLAPEMTGEEDSLLSQLLVAMVKKRLISSGSFKSASGFSCFRCSYKAESGQFYPLEDYFVFIHKPVIILKYEDISSVSIGRAVGAQTKLFEFDIIMQGGQTHSFSSVDRQESNVLLDFLKMKNITVRSAQPDLKLYGRSDGLSNQESDDEEDDDDEEADDDEEEEEDDDDDNESDEDGTEDLATETHQSSNESNGGR